MNDSLPVLQRFGFGKGFPHNQMLRMQRSVFDPKFPHQRSGPIRPIQRFGETVMFEDNVALFEEGRRRREVLAFGQSATLIEDPGVTDRAAGDRDAIDPSLPHHLQAIVRREEIAAAEDGFAWSGVLFDFH